MGPRYNGSGRFVSENGGGRWRTSDKDIWAPGKRARKVRSGKRGVDGVRAMGIYMPPQYKGRERSDSEDGVVDRDAYERRGYMPPGKRGAKGPFRKTGPDGARRMGIYGPQVKGRGRSVSENGGADGAGVMWIYGAQYKGRESSVSEKDIWTLVQWDRQVRVGKRGGR